MVSAAQYKKALDEIGVSRRTVDELVEHVATVDEGVLAQLISKGYVCHDGVVAGKSIIFAPPGYIVGVKSLNNQRVVGFRRRLVCKAPNEDPAFIQSNQNPARSKLLQSLCELIAS